MTHLEDPGRSPATPYGYRRHIDRELAPTIGGVRLSKLLDAGVPVPTVAARLGHADGTTTMKIYAHRTDRSDEQAAAVVVAALARRSS